MNILCFFMHKWEYFNHAGVGDFLDRVCLRCERHETYYGTRGYYHNKWSNEWMTKEEYQDWLKRHDRGQEILNKSEK